MRKLFILFFLLPPLAPWGCATLGVMDSTLELKVTPLPLYRGKPALAEINAPMDATQVVGTVEVMGSPQLLFRKDEKKREWYFYGAIPFSPWVNPGVYKVRVSASLPQGPPHYTEAQVELK
ncbi:MAG TPA: hypothetical protein VMU88_07320 [bacterium]|nr:hypothetical protein [bacterium]